MRAAYRYSDLTTQMKTFDKINKNSPIPRYYQLSQILMRRIKKMKNGERILSVQQLRTQFQVSQATIDKATSILASAGVVNCEAGKGMFVRNPQEIEWRENAQKTYLLGIIVPRIYGSHFGKIVENIEKTARLKKYHTILCNTYDKVSEEREYIQSLKERKVDGIIIAPIHLIKSIDNIASLQKHKKTFILLGHLPNLDADYVSDDGTLGAYKAVTHLIKLGHKRIGFVGSRFDIAFPDRFKGYKNAIAKHQIKFAANLVKLNSSKKTTNISESMKRFMGFKNKPTAIFCINDITAIEVIKSLQKLKKRIPKDVAIVGYDDLPASSSSEPHLSTVAMPGSKIGQKAAEVLIDKIEGKCSNEYNQILIEPRLVIRGSSGKQI